MIDERILYIQAKAEADILFFTNVTNIEKKSIFILHLKQDFLQSMSLELLNKLKHQFMEPKKISILIIDCPVTMETYRMVYSFDLCYISDSAAINFDPENIECIRIMNMLFGSCSIQGDSIRMIDCEGMLEYGVSNGWIKKDDFFENLKLEIISLTADRTVEQLYSIKKCMNEYKERILQGQLPENDLETEYFYKLAAIKIGEDINLWN